MVSIKMSVYTIFIVLFVAANQAVAAEESLLEQLYHQTAESAQKIATVLKESATGDLSDKDKVFAAYQKAASKISDSVVEYVKKVEKEAKPLSEEVKNNVNNAIKQLNETVKSLTSKDTEVKLQKIQETYIAGLKKIAEQSKDLGNSLGLSQIVPPEVQKKLQEGVEELAKNAQAFQAKVTEAVHKH